MTLKRKNTYTQNKINAIINKSSSEVLIFFKYDLSILFIYISSLLIKFLSFIASFD